MSYYDLSHRHVSVQQAMRWFETGHLRGTNKEIAEECEDLALSMIARLPDDPELTVGLRKLLEAKDAFVRTNVALNTTQE